MQTYHRFFYEFDKNRDGLIQRNEMARFLKVFMESRRNNAPVERQPNAMSDAYIREQVDKAWYFYDYDGSNYLDKTETMNFLKNFLREHNQPAPTMTQFNRFFQEYDLNRDGVISKSEMARFFKHFVAKPQENKIDQMVDEMWYDYDIERSGWLNKRETHSMLKDILSCNSQGPPTV